MATIRIPTPLRKLTQGKEEVTATGSTIGALIASLETQYPGIKERICDDSGQVRRFVNIFANDEDIRFLKNLETAVKDSDEISIVPAIAGRESTRPNGRRNRRALRAADRAPRGRPRRAGADLRRARAGRRAARRRSRRRRRSTSARPASVEVIAREIAPQDGEAWMEALAGVDLVVRAGFDDDAMLGAAKRLGLPVVVARATPSAGRPALVPAPGARARRLAGGPRAARAAPPTPGAADVLAGTLAAAEALVRLARIDGDIGRDASVTCGFPLDGGAPLAQEIGVA